MPNEPKPPVHRRAPSRANGIGPRSACAERTQAGTSATERTQGPAGSDAERTQSPGLGRRTKPIRWRSVRYGAAMSGPEGGAEQSQFGRSVPSQAGDDFPKQSQFRSAAGVIRPNEPNRGRANPDGRGTRPSSRNKANPAGGRGSDGWIGPGRGRQWPRAARVGLTRPEARPMTDPDPEQPGGVLVTDFDGTLTRHDFYRLVIDELLPPGRPTSGPNTSRAGSATSRRSDGPSPPPRRASRPCSTWPAGWSWNPFSPMRLSH